MNIGSIITDIESIFNWIQTAINHIGNAFDVDFTILYSWLPRDIVVVISAVITVLLFLALVGIIKKIIFFMG